MLISGLIFSSILALAGFSSDEALNIIANAASPVSGALNDLSNLETKDEKSCILPYDTNALASMLYYGDLNFSAADFLISESSSLIESALVFSSFFSHSLSFFLSVSAFAASTSGLLDPFLLSELA